MLNGLRDILLGNEVLVDEFAVEFKREFTRLRKQGHGARRRVLKDLQQVERGIKRCLDFVTGGDGDPGSVRDQLRRLDARKREIDVDLKAQQGEIEIAIHPNLPDLYRRKVAELQQMLEDARQRARRLSKIFARLLIESTSTPAKNGATARLLWWAHWLKSSPSPNKKRPPPPRETAVRS